MSFQFQCPQGHLLTGDPAHAGQHCNCPTCGMLFIIPAPIHAPAPAPAPAAWPPHPPAPPSPPAMPAEFHPPPAAAAPPAMPAIELSGARHAAAAPVAPQAPPPPKLLHIPCPNGHELECPLDMLGQDVLCPECGVQFALREQDSVEFKQKRKRERERKEQQLGDAWFKFAVVLGVLVVIGVSTLCIMLVFGPASVPKAPNKKTENSSPAQPTTTPSGPTPESNPEANPESNPAPVPEANPAGQ